MLEIGDIAPLIRSLRSRCKRGRSRGARKWEKNDPSFFIYFLALPLPPPARLRLLRWLVYPSLKQPVLSVI